MGIGEHGRPESSEYLPYFGQYIGLVPDGDIIETLASQIGGTADCLSAFTADAARWRPEVGEWNALEIVGHMVDTERVLAYRLLRIARADPALWESIEFEPYVEYGAFDERDLGEIMAEFVAVRGATVALMGGLGEAALARRMPEEWSCRSVRSLAYLIAGHERHHLVSLQAMATAATGSTNG